MSCVVILHTSTCSACILKIHITSFSFSLNFIICHPSLVLDFQVGLSLEERPGSPYPDIDGEGVFYFLSHSSKKIFTNVCKCKATRKTVISINKAYGAKVLALG